MKSRRRGVAILIIMAFGILTMLASCGGNSGKAQTVGDLAKENSPVYVEENGELVPFIVLTDQYAKGKSLLLRQEVLPEDLRMNEHSSYYAGSEIDEWLNGEYLDLLGAKDNVAETNLVITADSAIGYSSDETETVPRKVFLLSCAELGFDTSVNAAKEGSALSYFKDTKNRIASGEGQPASWLLRTPNTYFLSGCYAVSADGSLDTINASDETGIRPAFCVDGSREITEEEVTEGGSAYVLR